MIRNLLLSALAVLATVGCSETKEVKVFSSEEPYTVEIKKERSFYQAERIAQRLTKMGVGGYVIHYKTSDGDWYEVLSGAMKDEASAKQYVNELDSLYGIKGGKLVDFNKLDTLTRRIVSREIIKERYHIEANTPDVPQSVLDVISVYPENNMFYLQDIKITMLDSKAITKVREMNLEMPRGLTLYYFADKKCQSFASVIFEDNIYGDNVTLQVARCGNPDYQSAVAICDEVADKIIGAGKYDETQKNAHEVKASTLTGCKVDVKNGDKNRSYYILTDAGGNYIYIAQSTVKSEEDMNLILSQIGKSQGLVVYEEFYNTFYTIADKQIDKDGFLCYAVNKLTPKYAQDKGNASWAKKMVGHWNATLFFNSYDGIWDYCIFDMLNDGYGNEVYNNLYMDTLADDAKRDIYGVKGAAIYSYGDLTEMNFGYGRYVIAVNGDRHSEGSLTTRAESLQFVQGGYKKQ
ncbi:MAG: SPOR domain-containing protein [Marinilabiliaceae bacterium]|nr:SPOR domain-containing protein [Marinilabiliaceae bacterium]